VIVHELDWFATFGIVAIFTQVVRLWFVSRPVAKRRVARGASDDYLFVFLVPALNEARVLGHTLDSLLALPIRHSLVIVIDDGSDDGTNLLVERRSDRNVHLVRRELPLARRGKGPALNAGFDELLRLVRGWPAGKVIVGIMDADGRLDPQAPDLVAARFADPNVGAVQVGVRINNRHDSALARLQDMEFVTYTDVFQSARDIWGVALLGGNGQFVRLAAHLDLAPDPWTDGLTEDLEQGLRLICAGWQIRYCRDVAVHQQGLVSVRRLLRQRSRWFQGHLQAWRQIGSVVRNAPLRTVPHLLHMLMVPILLLANITLMAALLAMLAGIAESANVRLALAHPSVVLDWYWLTFALAIFLTVSVYARREHGLTPWRVILLGHAFAIYSLLWMVAGYWALGRILLSKRGWQKTDRLPEQPPEPLLDASPASQDAT